MENTFSFDDILILPNFKSEVSSRSLVNIESQLYDFTLPVPVMSASMSAFDTISPESRDISWQFAASLSDAGGMHIFSRSTLFEDRYDAAKTLGSNGKNVGIAVSLDEFYTFRKQLEDISAFVSIDIANGAIIKDIDWQGKYPLIIGNYGNPRVLGRADLRGNLIYKFGIGGGSSCSTRLETGVGAPQGWLIHHASKKSDRYSDGHKPIISDGGVKNTADFVKAVALGAEAVMMGYVFAGANETPWEPVKINGKWYKPYRGMASSQEKQTSSHVEGVSGYVPYEEKSVHAIVWELRDGLTSAMSYSNAFTLNEFVENVEFVLSPSSQNENQTRLING